MDGWVDGWKNRHTNEKKNIFTYFLSNLFPKPTARHYTFLYFVTQQKDLVAAPDAARVPVDPTDLQLSCVRGP